MVYWFQVTTGSSDFKPTVETYCSEKRVLFKMLLLVAQYIWYLKSSDGDISEINVFMPTNTTSILQHMDEGVILTFKKALCLATQSCLTLFNPMDCSPRGLSVHGIFPGKNTGVGCPFLLQGIFPTQGSNPHLLPASPTLAGEFFTTWAIWEVLQKPYYLRNIFCRTIIAFDSDSSDWAQLKMLDHWKSKRVPEKCLFLLYWLC